MFSKNNQHEKQRIEARRKQIFSIRKYHFGAASVAVGALLFLGGASAQASEEINKETEVKTYSTSTSNTEETVSTSELSNITRTAEIKYVINYVDADGKIVKTTKEVKSKEVTGKDLAQDVVIFKTEAPEGYELAKGQEEVVGQVITEGVENVITVKVVKEAKQEETVAKANKKVLEEVISEADLLAEEALRQVATTQVGNKELEVAANATKEVAKEAQAIFNDAEATQEVVDSKVEVVKARTKALHDEMLKVDEDGNVTAQLAVESSNNVFSNAGNTTYIIADSSNLNTATEHVRVSQSISGDIQTGQTSTWTVIFNEGNPATGYGHQLTRSSTHKFGIGNEVVGDITIKTYERSDANSAWTLVDSTTQKDWNYTDRQYYANKALLADYKQVVKNNGEGSNAELNTIHNIGDPGIIITAPNEAYHTFSRSFGNTTRQFKFEITAKIKAGRDAGNVAFIAGNDPGSTRNRYYSVTPAKVDPVTINPITAGQSSVTITPQEIAERIEVKVKNQNVVLIRQENGTYTATTNAANVTVNTNLATGTYTPTITLTLPTGTTFAEGDKVRAQSSIADASQINGSGLRSEQLISSDQGRQYSTISEVTVERSANQPTQSSNPKEIFVFKGESIKTVNPGTTTANPNVNSVSLGTVTDADGIASIAVTGGSSLGFDINNSAEATGTPTAGTGFYSRALKVTDSKGEVTTVFQNNPGNDQRFKTYILDTRVNNTPVAFNPGDTLESRKNDIFSKVTIDSGTNTTHSNYVEAGKYRKELKPGQTLRTTAGPQTVYVRVITASDVYKDVPVNITVPAQNQAPVVTPITDETNVDVDGAKNQAIYVFGVSQGSTEDINGAAGTSPVADKNKATSKVAEISDADGTISTIVYNDLKNNQPDLASGGNATPALTVSKDGYLEGKLIYGPGAKSTRRLIVTDNKGASTTSSEFKILGYTDKLKDTAAIEKAFGARPTTQDIFSKLTIDVNSSFPAAYPADLEIPVDQYTREVVGYRTITTTNGNETKGNLTTATADTLPTSGSYEVKVKTKNVYGQEIFNWVRVNHAENTPTVGRDKEPIYIFNNTEIATVTPGTDVAGGNNKVKIGTLEDPEGIQSVAIKNTTNLGYTVDTEGNASGTPSVIKLGVYSSALTVTDNTGSTTEVFPQSPTDQRYFTHIMDATAGEISKAVGEATTADEILAKVDVKTGNSNTKDPNITSRYRKVLLPDQQIPTTPGRHAVKVRVITASNVYKDVTVYINIVEAPTVTPNADGSVTVTPSQTDGVTKKVDVKYTDETGAEHTVTATKDDNGNWSVPEGSGVEVNATTGAVTIPANSVQDGSTVKAVSKDKTDYPSKEATGQAQKDPQITDTVNPVVPPKVSVKDPANLTEEEKAKIIDEVKKANPDFPEGTKVEVGNDGKVTVTYPDGSKDTIPGIDLVYAYKHGAGAYHRLPYLVLPSLQDNDENSKFETSEKGDISSESNDGAKLGNKLLSNTGETSTTTTMAGIGLLALAVGLLSRRKENK